MCDTFHGAVKICGVGGEGNTGGLNCEAVYWWL